MDTHEGTIKTVLVEKSAQTFKLIIKHSASLNSLMKEVVIELKEALNAIRKDKSIKVVLITGTGRAFCSGGNLSELATINSEAAGQDYVAGIHVIIQQIAELPQIVITAVNGLAIGAGCSLALAGDIIIASEDAKFALPFLNVGLVPDCGSSYYLPRIVGLARAKELLFTGRIFNAREAWEMGLISNIVPACDFDALVEQTIQKIAGGPTKALTHTKFNLQLGQEQGLIKVLEAEANAQGICLQTEDHKIGVKALKEKCKPHFIGG